MNDNHCGRVAPSVRWTHLWGSIVPVKLASHPTYETRGNANPHECRDCNAGSSRYFRIGENHGSEEACRVRTGLQATADWVRGPMRLAIRRPKGAPQGGGSRSSRGHQNVLIHSVIFIGLASCKLNRLPTSAPNVSGITRTSVWPRASCAKLPLMMIRRERVRGRNWRTRR